jgi:putrescine transport system permease protein
VSRRHREDRVGLGRVLLIAVPFTWLTAFFLLPFLIVLKLSLSEPTLAQPPYSPIVEWVDEAGDLYLAIRLRVQNYLTLLSDGLYLAAFASSLRIAAVATLLALLIGFPIALGMARCPARIRPFLLLAVMLPFWTSFLIRVYAWMGILKDDGLLNAVLLGLGLVDRPLVILNTEAAVLIGIVYSYLPFMILPIFANLEKHDPSLLEAAIDLGCRPWKAFWRVTVPLARPGILAGCFLVFIPAVGEFVVPDLLGGADTLMIGRTLWLEFFTNRDWPLASAVAILMLLVLVVPIVLFQRQQALAQLR